MFFVRLLECFFLFSIRFTCTGNTYQINVVLLIGVCFVCLFVCVCSFEFEYGFRAIGSKWQQNDGWVVGGWTEYLSCFFFLYVHCTVFLRTVAWTPTETVCWRTRRRTRNASTVSGSDTFEHFARQTLELLENNDTIIITLM